MGVARTFVVTIRQAGWGIDGLGGRADVEVGHEDTIAMGFKVRV